MKSKIPKPAKSRKAWFAVEPGGRIVSYSCRTTREESMRDFMIDHWSSDWDDMYAAGYRFVQCEITPIVKRRN